MQFDGVNNKEHQHSLVVFFFAYVHALDFLVLFDGCLCLFPVWGLMAGLPGFTSHGRSLHLGAGYQ